MAVIVWLALLVLIIANGWNTVLWIFMIGSVVVVVVGATGRKQQERKKTEGAGNSAMRIDHLHYIDLDEHECPNCGATFRKDVMTCPECGTKFIGKEEIDDEFIEEMELWDDDD